MDYNKEAFNCAQKSTTAPTFLEARAILADIQIKKITNQDVLEYVQYCNELADFCIKYGISRDNMPTFLGVITGTDYRKAAGITIWESIKDLSIINGPAKMILSGLWMRLRLSGWFKLHDKLTKQYSPEGSKA
ncbi:hypothetical protein [Acaryochloris marina]|uniref:Uncharacterized protein n=1 Tax=Acaryochloris marina (strain MBIC 11017) TaxID=329726 RepID=A8ZR15_ACAM1|nr:hypothetical protein [Acaryochloris marina]ABW33451.1 hypothetical protein AM1_H0101 [Acaryochloris marina MBIC11017]